MKIKNVIASAISGTALMLPLSSFGSEGCANEDAQHVTVVGVVEHSLLAYLGECYQLNELALTENLIESTNTFLNGSKSKQDVLVVGQDLDSRFEMSIESTILNSLDNDIKVLLVQPESDELGKFAGVGFSGSDFTILRKHNGHVIVEPFFSGVQAQDVEQVGFRNESNHPRSQNGVVAQIDQNEKTTGREIGLSTEVSYEGVLNALANEYFPRVDTLMAGSNVSTMATDGDLPSHQSYKGYIRPYRKDYIWSNSQSFENDVTFEYTFLASHQPYAKYIRVAAMGAGFNPTAGGSMVWNNEYDRGFFQNKINISMKAQGSEVIPHAHSPHNVNGQTSYTSSSSISVGVDVSENPGFSGSYTVGTSETTNIPDFDIIDRTSSRHSNWDFHLGMTKNSIWDIFQGHFLAKDTVKSLPNLATSNFTPKTVSVWRVGGGDNGAKPFEINWTVQYMNTYVTGDWLSFTRRYISRSRGQGWWSSNPINFYISNVSS